MFSCNRYTLLLPLLLLVTCQASISERSAQKRIRLSPYDEPGYEMYVKVMTSLVSMADHVVDLYSSVLENKYPGRGQLLQNSVEGFLKDIPSPQTVEQFLDGTVGNLRPENTTCNLCRALMGTLVGLVRNGSDYESIKNATMEICYLVVPIEHYNPDLLCELVLDTYAPHVIYVLNTTQHDPTFICQFYNFCEGDVPPPVSAPRIQSTNQRKRTEDIRHESGFARPIRVLHFTDAHIDHEYDVGAPLYCDMPLCCRSEYNGNGSGMFWGDYKCNIPPYTAEHVFSNILTQFTPDIILYTGDTVQHTVWDQPQDETIASDKWLSDELWHFFPGIPAYFAMGNHDMTPTNLYYVKRPEIQELNAALFDHWTRLSKFTDAQRVTFEHGIYYTASPFPGLRILSYNSEYGALDNFYSMLIYDEPEYGEMLQWMNETLANAEANGEKVIMLGHHPTGGNNKMPGYNRFIIDLQSRYGDNVVLHLLGHNHDDKFALVKDYTTGETRGVQISSPSMTSYTDTNPSVRMFYLDPDTYLPIDMETYRLDLAVDGNSANPRLKLTYSATGDYGMADATPSSFEGLTNRLETDDALFDEFLYNVDTATGLNGPCNDACRARLLCDLRNADAEGRSACRSALPRN